MNNDMYQQTRPKEGSTRKHFTTRIHTSNVHTFMKSKRLTISCCGKTHNSLTTRVTLLSRDSPFLWDIIESSPALRRLSSALGALKAKVDLEIDNRTLATFCARAS